MLCLASFKLVSAQGVDTLTMCLGTFLCRLHVGRPCMQLRTPPHLPQVLLTSVLLLTTGDFKQGDNGKRLLGTHVCSRMHCSRASVAWQRQNDKLNLKRDTREYWGNCSRMVALGVQLSFSLPCRCYTGRVLCKLNIGVAITIV